MQTFVRRWTPPDHPTRPCVDNSPVLAYLALGSNLGNRLAHLQAAVDGLQLLPGIRVEGVSSVYESPAVTRGEEQPPYLNAVAAVTI